MKVVLEFILDVEMDEEANLLLNQWIDDAEDGLRDSFDDTGSEVRGFLVRMDI